MRNADPNASFPSLETAPAHIVKISWWGGGHKTYPPGDRLDQPTGSLPLPPVGREGEREREIKSATFEYAAKEEDTGISVAYFSSVFTAVVEHRIDFHSHRRPL